MPKSKPIRFCVCDVECPIHGEAGGERAEYSSARNALDAARYRWLRAMIYDDRIIVAPDRMLNGYALDEAIDDALENPDAR